MREQFSLTTVQAKRAMQEMKKQPGVRGCILLSTCNRMELWMSTGQKIVQNGVTWVAEVFINLLEEIKQIKLEAACYEPYLNYRQDQDAAEHLFYLAAGLKSRILGEDQILTQVKEALQRSREIYCTDTLLEVLFRYAVTAGKEVKTHAPMPHTDSSVAHYAIAGLKQQGYVFAGKRCLVIGNGQMGKLAAQALQEEGAAVTVTVRQYKSGRVEIPKGCSRIHYGQRYELMAKCDVIVSATVSPNLTIRKAELETAREHMQKDQIYIDLAVPRDMEAEIAQLTGITLYNIDAFESNSITSEADGLYRKAEALLKIKLEEFLAWYQCRELVPRLKQIGQYVAEDICWRMQPAMCTLPKGTQEEVSLHLQQKAAKAVDRLLFTLRDGLPREELYHCVELLERRIKEEGK